MLVCSTPTRRITKRLLNGLGFVIDTETPILL